MMNFHYFEKNKINIAQFMRTKQKIRQAQKLAFKIRKKMLKIRDILYNWTPAD